MPSFPGGGSHQRLRDQGAVGKRRDCRASQQLDVEQKRQRLDARLHPRPINHGGVHVAF